MVIWAKGWTMYVHICLETSNNDYRNFKFYLFSNILFNNLYDRRVNQICHIKSCVNHLVDLWWKSRNWERINWRDLRECMFEFLSYPHIFVLVFSSGDNRGDKLGSKLDASPVSFRDFIHACSKCQIYVIQQV